jgi:hypothetical protein
MKTQFIVMIGFYHCLGTMGIECQPEKLVGLSILYGLSDDKVAEKMEHMILDRLIEDKSIGIERKPWDFEHDCSFMQSNQKPCLGIDQGTVVNNFAKVATKYEQHDPRLRQLERLDTIVFELLKNLYKP